MLIHLKVKIKSLAAEARIIRLEEQRATGRGRRIMAGAETHSFADTDEKWQANNELREGLTHHRKNAVRKAARHALLAYGFLRGRAYRDIETRCRTEPYWPEVQRLVKKYGPPHRADELKAWREVTVAKILKEETDAWRAEA
jgi:hypothetical protein